jgi:hypothetical protein
MNTTEIVTIDNQFILRRFYKRDGNELASYLFYLPEMPSEEEVQKLKDEVFLKETILDIDSDGLDTVYQFFNEKSLYSYCAWVKNKKHLYYISISYKTKISGEVVVKKTSLKPKFFDEIEVIDKDFIKTKSEVFYLGKKIVGADGVSFKNTISEFFYEDKNRIYSFYNFRINILEKQLDTNYFFIPFCDCFASEQAIYDIDGWTDKMKQVSGDFTGSIFYQHLEIILSILYPELSEKECIDLREKVGYMKNYETIFQTIFPDADAKWSKTN